MNIKEIIKQGIELYNKHYPNDKHTTKKEKTAFVNFFVDLYKVTGGNSIYNKAIIKAHLKTIKVLQSKVKTYEADINKCYNIVDSEGKNPKYIYHGSCYCVKCKEYRSNNLTKN